MSLSQDRKRQKNLEHLEKMLQLSKLSVINDLSSKKSISSQAFSFAHLTREIFYFAKKHMDINSKFVNKIDLNKNAKLIIFISPSKTLLGSSNKWLNKTFDQTYKQGDYVIAIFDDAISHLKNKDITPSLAVPSNKKVPDISSIIFNLFSNDLVGSIQFVIHSPRVVKNTPLIILPLENSNIEKGEAMIDQNIKYNFYPNILSILNKLFYNYISSITKVLLLDSEFYRLKQKLVKHENSLSSIDKMKKEIQKAISKDRQQKLTEEIMIVLKASSFNEEDS